MYGPRASIANQGKYKRQEFAYLMATARVIARRSWPPKNITTEGLLKTKVEIINEVIPITPRANSSPDCFTENFLNNKVEIKKSRAMENPEIIQLFKTLRMLGG